MSITEKQAFVAPGCESGHRDFSSLSFEASDTRQLAETCELKPVIDRSYALEQIAVAHSYVDAGQKKGNVVITVRALMDYGLCGKLPTRLLVRAPSIRFFSIGSHVGSMGSPSVLMNHRRVVGEQELG